jgi:hypothetical protein
MSSSVRFCCGNDILIPLKSFEDSGAAPYDEFNHYINSLRVPNDGFGKKIAKKNRAG